MSSSERNFRATSESLYFTTETAGLYASLSSCLSTFRLLGPDIPYWQLKRRAKKEDIFLGTPVGNPWRLAFQPAVS